MIRKAIATLDDLFFENINIFDWKKCYLNAKMMYFSVIIIEFNSKTIQTPK